MDAPPRHLPAERRRALTVETVIDLAAEQNPGEITTAAIAKRMNLTQGALFRHFPSKEAIWEAVMTWVGERLLGRVDKVIAAGASPLATLEGVFMAHVDFIARHPGVPRMLFGELQRAVDTPAKRVARTLMDRYRQRLATLLDSGKAAGEVDPAVDVQAAAVVFIGTIQGLVVQSLLAANTHGLKSQAPRAFSLYRRGIERRG